MNKTGLIAKISIKYVLPTCIWKYFWRISRYFTFFGEFRGISRKYLNFAGLRPREISEALYKTKWLLSYLVSMLKEWNWLFSCWWKFISCSIKKWRTKCVGKAICFLSVIIWKIPSKSTSLSFATSSKVSPTFALTVISSPSRSINLIETLKFNRKN